MEVQKLIGDECNCPLCLVTTHWSNKAPTLPGIVQPEPVQDTLPGLTIPLCPVGRYTAYGKQVLCDGEQYADAVDENAASCIAHAMNGAEQQAEWAQLLAQVK
jgi:hypothetical protein